MIIVAIALCACFFLWMGLLALRRPDRLLRLYDAARPREARNEVRAVYGGYGIAMAALLLAGCLDGAQPAGVWRTIAAAMAGMAGGRLYSAALDRRMGGLQWRFAGIEAGVRAVMLLAIWAARQ